MSRRAYLPIAVELPSRKGVTFEVLPAGTFNRVTVYQRTRAGLRRVKNPEIVQRVVKEIERQNKVKDVLSQVHRAAGRCTETEGPDPFPSPHEVGGPPRARRVRRVVDARDPGVHAVKVGSLFSGVGGFDLGHAELMDWLETKRDLGHRAGHFEAIARRALELLESGEWEEPEGPGMRLRK